MRKKIEINMDSSIDAEMNPPPSSGETPEFGDHVAPVETADSDTAVKSMPGEGAIDYITALQAELEEARSQAEETEKRLLYNHAEFQNFRRRKEEEFRDLQKFSNSDLIKSLLPIIDNFERALSAAEQTRNFDALVSGVSGTLKQIQTFLQKAGVKPIESLGAEFDPRLHEAIGHTDTQTYQANTVSEEVQRGYMMHDRILRPTLVKVAQD